MEGLVTTMSQYLGSSLHDLEDVHIRKLLPLADESVHDEERVIDGQA